MSYKLTGDGDPDVGGLDLATPAVLTAIVAV